MNGSEPPFIQKIKFNYQQVVILNYIITVSILIRKDKPLSSLLPYR